MENEIVIATAGSRKTTYIVEQSLKYRDKRILISTYTIDNLKLINEYLVERNGVVPSNLTVQSWYSFLLTDGVRPYQNFVYDKSRIGSINFIEGRSAHYVKKSNIDRYYFSSDGRIFTDKISEFACRCNDKSNGLLIDRLERIYDHIYIDESQDLAGYDFEFLELLLLSRICVLVVGDSRQATFFTNCSPKNSQFKGKNILHIFRHWENNGICKIVERNENYRCNQAICDFSDKLYPEMPKTISYNDVKTGHDGIYIISRSDIEDYYAKYSPKVLRYSRITKTNDLPALNFGLAKGQNFDRVLIFPNNPLMKYLEDGDGSRLKDETRAKFYVALTRARYSVAFCYDDKTVFEEIIHYS